MENDTKGFGEGLIIADSGYYRMGYPDAVGFKDEAGNLVIPYKYNSVKNFSEGLAAVNLIDGYIYHQKGG